METHKIDFRSQPGLLKGLLLNEKLIKESGLDSKLLELIKLRISQLNSCAYCIDMHFKEAVNMGENIQRLYSLTAWKECPCYSENEQAVLYFIESIYQGNIPPDIFNKVAGLYSEHELSIITLAVANINSWNILNKTFGTTPGSYNLPK